jgi:hypothetical protein
MYHLYTGSIKVMRVRNVTDGIDDDLGEFIVTDQFDARSFVIEIPFEVVYVKNTIYLFTHLPIFS